MPKGGRRPGAGAPSHNLNAVKNGFHSMQMVEALLAADPATWDSFLARANLPAAAIMRGRHGGSRAGAGAPPRNLNGMKNGVHSIQLAKATWKCKAYEQERESGFRVKPGMTTQPGQIASGIMGVRNDRPESFEF